MPTSLAPKWPLTTVNVFPVKGEPGRSLRQAVLTDSGLVGDRAKKRPLLVATAAQAGDGELRANFVLDMPDDVLYDLAGQELRIGDVVIRLTRRPSACEGLYAEVVRGGDVIVGDRAAVVHCLGTF